MDFLAVATALDWVYSAMTTEVQIDDEEEPAPSKDGEEECPPPNPWS